MCPRPNTHFKSVNPSSLSRRSLQPVLTQAFVATLRIEANNQYWEPQFGVVDHYLAFETMRRRWHKY